MKDRFFLAVFVLVLLGALSVRYRGIDWARFHPDEPTIERWMEDSERNGIIWHHGYPSGFFRLIWPVRMLTLEAKRLGAWWDFWTGGRPATEPNTLDGIYLARVFNVWLGAATVLLMYGLAKRITASRAAGLMAAGLMAFAQLHVEHSHYGETDIALIFLLTLSLLLWAEALSRGRWRWILGAGLATGAAVATKYTAVLLVALPVAAALQQLQRDAKVFGVRRAAGWLALGLAGIVIGFVLMNPGVLEWSAFEAAVREGARRTYNERLGLLGPLAHAWWAPVLMKLHQGAHDAYSLGPGWLLLLVPGVGLALRSRFRRYASITLLFPLLYAIHFVFLAPWVRSQEFMPFYPSLAALASLPLAASWSRATRSARCIGLLVLALSLWSLADNVCRGVRTAAIFQWPDSRQVADRWLARHVSEDSRIGFERYSFYAIRDFPGTEADISKIERSGRDVIEAAGCDLMLRNASTMGRGTVDPRTNERFTLYQALFDDFMSHAELLRRWGPLSPGGTTFASPIQELYGVQRERAVRGPSVCVARPAWVSSDQLETFNTPALPLGSDTCLLVGPEARTIAFGGPEPVPRPVYIVLATEDRGALVRVRGFSSGQEMEMAPYDVTVVRLQRPPWSPSWNSYEFVTLSAESARHVTVIPCYAWVAYTVEDVIRIGNACGRPDRVFGAIKNEQVTASSDAANAYIAAVEAGRAEVAEALEPRARGVLGELTASLQSKAMPCTVQRVGPQRYANFARVRLQRSTDFQVNDPDQHAAIRPEDIDWRAAHASIDSTLLPLYLAGGTYTFTCQMTARDPTNVDALVSGAFSIRDLYGDELFEGNWSNYVALGQNLMNQMASATGKIDAGAAASSVFQNRRAGALLGGQWSNRILRGQTLSLSLPARSGRRVALCFTSDVPVEVNLSRMELRWQRNDLLRALRSRLVDALAQRALDRGDAGAARELLAGDPETQWNPARRRALAFRAEWDAKTINYDDLRSAAKELLAAAPAHFEALDLLSKTEMVHLFPTRHREAAPFQPFRFEPFAELVNATWTNGTLRCVVQFTHDDVPPLAVAVVFKRRTHWKTIVSRPIGGRLLYQAGERVVVDLPLADRSPVEKMGIGICTRVRWNPDWLEAPGYRDGRIPLRDVLQAPSANETAAR